MPGARRVAAAIVALVLLAGGCTGETATATAERRSGDGDEPSVELAAQPTPTAEPTPTPEGPQPLNVVTIMGETGVMAPIDLPAVAGVSARIDQLNEQGGVLDRPIELTRIDTESRASLADRLADRLLRDPPDLLIVSCDVDFSKPVLEMADEEGLLTISPCAADVGYGTSAWGPRNFSLGATSEIQGAVAAEATIQRYGPTVIVLRDRTSPEALRFCNGFERTFREIGGTVQYRDEFSYDTPEPLLDRLDERPRETDAIIMCSHVPGGSDAAPNVIEQIRLLGFSAPIVAGSTLDEPTWFSSAPQLGELTYVSWSSIFGNDPDDRVNELIALANGDDQTPLAGVSTVLGADTIDAWARAVASVRSAEPSRVAAALASFDDEPFLTGSISFVAGSRIDTSRTYRVIRVVGGEVREPELVVVDG